LIRLSKYLRSIYLVFHISQLEFASSSQIPNYYNPPLLSVEVVGYLEFEVAQILDSKLDKQWKDPLLYYVCWVDYEGTSKEYSWLIANDLENTTELLANFYYHHPNKPGPILASYPGTSLLT